ncbi:MAG TPA: acetyl-coenzyme A synthetase N-terminal domain-containing protein, partial [Candidatus Acidoferrales bacterium]|nr:acetyl-coenzyme A synthetase N-terminal domain-containing protein [Candidatus Acidoferrales bacterium]
MSTATSFAWTPTREQAEQSRLRAFMRALGAADLDAVANLARADPQRFWAAVVDDIGIDWVRRFDTAMDTSDGLPWTRFWVGGRMNLAANAVHRRAATKPDAAAVVWEGDDGSTRHWSCAELAEETSSAAAVLRGLDVGAG